MSTVKSRVKYRKVATEDVEETDAIVTKSKLKRVQFPKNLSEDDYYDDQFEDTTPVKIPVKSIFVAVVLFLVGSVFLTLGSLMLAGVISEGGGSFRAMPLMVIGSIVFIPGAYNVRTAYYAWKGYHGYSFADIAGFGEDQ